MIKAFIGRYGTGKTLSMVHEAYYWLPRRIKIVSNTPLSYRFFKFNDFNTLKKTGKFGSWAYIDAEVVSTMDEYFAKFETETDTIFVLDEAGTWLNSYKWEKVSDKIYTRFQQTRKVNIHLLYTAQFFNFVVKQLRQITDVVTKCEVPIRMPANPNIPYDKGRPLLIRKIDYNPEFFEQKGIPTIDQEQKFIEGRSFIWGAELDHVFHSYDTKKLIA